MESPLTTYPSTKLTIVEVLQLYLTWWNAIVTNFRRSPVQSFEELDEKYKDSIVMKVNGVSGVSWGQLPPGTSPELVLAYKKLNKCDTFCYVLYHVLKEHLQKYNATVSWVVLNPRPDMVFAAHGNPPSPTRHSVLWIQQKSKNISLIFDGTAEQFGWAASNAISNTYNYLKQFTSALEDRYFRYGDLKDVGDKLQGHDRGYWLEAIPKLLGLWRRLDWELLEAVPARARLEYIRRAADQEFRIIAARKWDNTISSEIVAG